MFLPVRWGAPVRACKRGPDAQKEKRRKANSKRRYAGLRVPNPQTGAPHRGQNKSRFRLEAAHFVQKTKCADFNMKSAAVGRFFAHCNRKSLAAANTQSRFSASNTVLLTCVIGNPPAPTSYLLTGFPCNGELSSRRIAPPRRGLTRTAPFRVGLATFFCLPILPEGVRNRRVLRYLNIQFYLRTRRGAPSR